MKDLFSYPFDAGLLLKKQKSLKKQLKGDGRERTPVRIAILSGSTADAVRDQLELFLLNYGLEPSFYLSEYGKYWEDAMFPPETLIEFSPDLVYFHTTYRNIEYFPTLAETPEAVEKGIDGEILRYKAMWESVRDKLGAAVIQNNFELPPFRLLGNMDASDPHGRVRTVDELNRRFAEYAASEKSFYLNDLRYISACYGLDRWADSAAWLLYKYALALPAIPFLAANLAAIVKAIYGKNKKVLALDLDNTLWGGVVGDDGVEGLRLGRDLPAGQVYSEFQEYVKLHKDLGVLLTVCSKNDAANALAGLAHPDSLLKPDDFTVIKANWENKDRNLAETAAELNLLTESFVFADDNPAEREIVREQLPGTAVPELTAPEEYIRVLDRNRYFETVSLSADDRERGEMYRANAARAALEKTYADYGEYLDGLSMTAEIMPFAPPYLGRIAQLTNKSNQFNLTTRRYTEAEITAIADDPERIALYGRLSDRFGDNGVVAVVIGRVEGEALHLDLWLMSCRVLKREMELAMLDEVVRRAKERGIAKIFGYYRPTAKNGMVKELYGDFGFKKVAESEEETVWKLAVNDHFPKTKHITVTHDCTEGKDG
ncbi:MAG: HAD-IIIC family phosphatase [Bacteroides sp.]|nr:HAD-IIIC family phosphatase [Eubacterium sp.]MCM1418510.1 HAD-IIIC family phosphatase [Roseburia sp.]MCM1462529.1 HAD-IIIC family phosphatase [Bacteroides sp.]